jgi:hypothetical protein
LKHAIAGHQGPVLIQYSLENCRPRDTRGTDILEAHVVVALIEFSALEPLTDMGYTVEEAYGWLCSEAFYDGVLEKKLTGIMEKIRDPPTPNGTDDSAPMEFSFLVNEEFMEVILNQSGSVPRPEANYSMSRHL